MALAQPGERWSREWLEADGLGGFASGTVAGVAHAPLPRPAAGGDPATDGRMVLVNGLEVWLETAAGRFALSTQRYTPGVTYPDGERRIVDFVADPWPCWTFRAEDGTEVMQEIVAHHGQPEVALRWRLGASESARLIARPLLAGRDYHACTTRTRPSTSPPRFLVGGSSGGPIEVSLRSHCWPTAATTTSRPGIATSSTRRSASAASTSWRIWPRPAPSPGSWREHDAVLVLAQRTRRRRAGRPNRGRTAVFAAETKRREMLDAPLQRAADAYVVRRGAGKTIIAGYPWFTDWGRDTFIALRGF